LIGGLLRRRRVGRARKAVAEAAIDFGEPVLTSRITNIANGLPWYRGQDATRLAQTASLEETAALLERYGPACPLLDTIGYGEARQVLAGSLEPAVALLRTEQRTRQYAKRQRTWFRRQHRPLWLGQDVAAGAGRDGGDLLRQAVAAAGQGLV